MAEREHIIAARRQVPGYAEDYAAWLQHQIDLMRAGRWSDLDTEHLIDEVEDLGRSEFNAFVSAVEIVLVHMLKWDFQPERRTPSSIASIIEHRRRIVRLLKQNPSYKSRIAEAIEVAYDTAQAKASGQTNLPLATFPSQNPYGWEAITMREHVLDA
ncbi:MAG: DUF29 domain-containing protein [Sphingomonas sp.]|uniref:DUF29 domain-containing protein n=1 Tax=Sphingomonas sp. TaxID=28214 RepID=UPI0025D33C0D|nr:DUF29 domain-containing protein [Sphingomonas sp.]MBY0285392.1 DUF29 domain-containing protein [Sphingomonas sp.]